jgi:transposase, IS5 family
LSDSNLPSEGLCLMLRDRYARVDLFALVPALELRFEPELAELDRLLEDDQLFQHIKADLARRRPLSLRTGRPSTPVEVILRLLVIQHLYAWSYEQTEHFVNDSLVLRQFCRLGLEPVPHDTTLLRWANLVQPETLHRLLDRVTELAQGLRVTRGRKLRIDSTVVETAVHYPTDSSLLADGVRVLSRLVDRARDVLKASAEPCFRNRTRSAKQLAQRIYATAAVHASRATTAERPELYRRLLEVAHASLRQAEQVQHRLASWSADGAAQRLSSDLVRVGPLLRQVCVQTERRVFDGEVVPAADKVLSLFEPHTAVLRRGKARVPAEFGRKVLLDEVDGGLVSRYAVLVGNPPDAEQLPTSLAQHRARFGRPPDVLTADRAFHTAANERLATEQGVRCSAIPKPGLLSPRRRAFERHRGFRRAYRFRAGIEGRISVLKRGFGLARCRYHGEAGMERWVGLGILAHNLRQISHVVALRQTA